MIKMFEDFSKEEVSWETLEKIGELFHNKIMKSPLKEYYLDSAACEHKDEARDWDIVDNNMEINNLDIEFHFYFNKFTLTDFYIEDINKKIDEFKKIVLFLSNMSKGLRLGISDVNSKYGQDTDVKIFLTTKDIMIPEIKNIISSVDGINKFNL